MSDTSEEAAPPAERVHDIPRMLRAMQQAVREAIWRHKLAGHPVAVWRDGRVVWIQPEDIPESFAPPPSRELGGSDPKARAPRRRRQTRPKA